VINRGYSGYNTLWCKDILSPVLKSILSPGLTTRVSRPIVKIMTLMLGANDSALKEFNPRQHVPVSDYKKFLNEMLQIMRIESPQTRVIVITPTPVDPIAWGNKCLAKGNKADRSIAHTRLYRDACITVGEEAKAVWGNALVLIDSWEVFLGKGKVEYEPEDVAELLSDGLHLAPKGNNLIAAAVLDTIKISWPDLDPDEFIDVTGISDDENDTATPNAKPVFEYATIIPVRGRKSSQSASSSSLAQSDSNSDSSSTCLPAAKKRKAAATKKPVPRTPREDYARRESELLEKESRLVARIRVVKEELKALESLAVSELSNNSSYHPATMITAANVLAAAGTSSASDEIKSDTCSNDLDVDFLDVEEYNGDTDDGAIFQAAKVVNYFHGDRSVDDLQTFDESEDILKASVPEFSVAINADVLTFDFAKLAETIQFDVIMMDPPWQLASNAPSRGVAISYSQLTDASIESMPIEILQKNGYIFIWVINTKYVKAFEMLEKWGYTYCDDVTWVKRTVNRRMAKGHGYYLQHAKETCVVGYKGDVVFPSTDFHDGGGVGSDVIYSERRGQSQKPTEMYELIEKLVPNGKYLEIFGRKNNLRNYWVTIGNEL
ncbi:hypothetical protein HK100_004158, partial [Physocladia obscura]